MCTGLKVTIVTAISTYSVYCTCLRNLTILYFSIPGQTTVPEYDLRKKVGGARDGGRGNHGNHPRDRHRREGAAGNDTPSMEKSARVSKHLTILKSIFKNKYQSLKLIFVNKQMRFRQEFWYKIYSCFILL